MSLKFSNEYAFQFLLKEEYNKLSIEKRMFLASVSSKNIVLIILQGAKATNAYLRDHPYTTKAGWGWGVAKCLYYNISLCYVVNLPTEEGGGLKNW